MSARQDFITKLARHCEVGLIVEFVRCISTYSTLRVMAYVPSLLVTVILQLSESGSAGLLSADLAILTRVDAQRTSQRIAKHHAEP